LNGHRRQDMILPLQCRQLRWVGTRNSD